MNKYIFIGLIVLILVPLGGLWLYLLLFGTPQATEEVFINLGFEEQAPERPRVIIPDPDTVVDVGTSGNLLNQLTTRPVAGFVGIETASSSYVRYVERGTGHVYEINLNNGAERRLSGSTLPQIVEAYFAEDGSEVVLVQEVGFDTAAHFGEVDEGNIEFSALPNNSQDFYLPGDGTVWFTLAVTNGAVGYRYDVAARLTEEIFRTPLRDITVYWNNETAYLFPKPSKILEGALYQVDRTGENTRLTEPQYGFVATPGQNDSWLLGAIATQEQVYRSYLLDPRNTSKSGNGLEMAVYMIPEKCAQHYTDTVWCIAPLLGLDNIDYLYDWYRGQTQEDNYLWRVDPQNGSARLVVDFKTSIGFAVDAAAVVMVNNRLFFINRLNGSLWSYSVE